LPVCFVIAGAAPIFLVAPTLMAALVTGLLLVLLLFIGEGLNIQEQRQEVHQRGGRDVYVVKLAAARAATAAGITAASIGERRRSCRGSGQLLSGNSSLRLAHRETRSAALLPLRCPPPRRPTVFNSLQPGQRIRHGGG
jgi:hypothetical protein